MKQLFNLVIHLSVAVLVLLTMDYGVWLLFKNYVYNFLVYFNNSPTWVIVFFLVIATGLLANGASILINFITSIGGIVFQLIPKNSLSNAIAGFLSIINIISLLIYIWLNAFGYSFWLVIEMLILSAFVWNLIRIVMPIKEQEKILRERNESYKEYPEYKEVFGNIDKP